MKRILSVILTLVLAFSLFVGCQQAGSRDADSTPGDEKLSVVSVGFPGYDFTRELAGERVNLTMLLPPGSESHSFEPTPQNTITIQNCDVFIYAGGESDTWADGMLDSMDTSNMTILSMMDIVEVVEEEIKEGMEEDEEEKAEYDEHVWTSPINAICITQAIADTLCALDEDNADTYRANCSVYVEKLEELDAFFCDTVQNNPRDTLIFGDRFPFRYLVDEYGLDYYAAFPGCSSESEASAKTIAFLIDKTNNENIPVVFYIEFSNEKMADTICESTGSKKLLLHSCHNVTKDDFESGVSYIGLMTQNAKNLKEALS